MEDVADVLGVEPAVDVVAQRAAVLVVQLEVEHVVVRPVDELVAQLSVELVVVAEQAAFGLLVAAGLVHVHVLLVELFFLLLVELVVEPVVVDATGVAEAVVELVVVTVAVELSEQAVQPKLGFLALESVPLMDVEHFLDS